MKKLYILFFLTIFLKSNAQFTSIPDAIFEQELIDQGIDSDLTINGHVLTSDVKNITILTLNSDITGYIVNLTGIEDFIELQELFFSAYSLQIIDVSYNQNLKKLVLGNPQISSINISTNLALETFYLSEANNITSVDVSNNINLKVLGISYINLTQLDVSNNINLEILGLKNTQINQINLSNNTQLKTIGFDNNPLSNIDLTQNTILKEFSVYYSLLTSLNVSQNPLLEVLYCGNNRITFLNLNNNPLLNVVSCENYINNNYLSSIYLQNGSNSLLNGVYDFTGGVGPVPVYKNRFDSTNNSNLHCIFVDDVANCNTNWLGKDATSNYASTQQECDNLQSEEFIANSFLIYPNPVNDILFIENSKNNEILKIVVYDLMGKMVVEQNDNSSEINFSNISNGLYLIKIATEKETIVKKIAKK